MNMARNLTFGKKIGFGFAILAVLTLLTGVVAILSLRTVVSELNSVLSRRVELLTCAEKLEASVERRGGAVRGFLVAKDPRFLEHSKNADADIARLIERLGSTVITDEGRGLLKEVEKTSGDLQTVNDKILALRQTHASMEAIDAVFERELIPKRDVLDKALAAFSDRQERILEEGRKRALGTASSATGAVVSISIAMAILAGVIATFLTRGLTRQVGSAVSQIQSSSAEFQAAANQQATGSKEQATAVTEVSTTINELLATSHQIAESAQRVMHIAEGTARQATSGRGTVDSAHEHITAIRNQVDQIVSHMLDLGKKSHQIGSVLEIVSELAEQTNILAINATIEAAGAGEAGKRFGVVADEIRKLADRVGNATKEIRGLIDDVRGAVNTTVMATESGSKTVDAGSRKFDEVAVSFKEIADMVGTTTDAAREIELSTRQQSSAVEQVNSAIAGVAQAAQESQASASQILLTASQLASLSRELLLIVQPQQRAPHAP